MGFNIETFELKVELFKYNDKLDLVLRIYIPILNSSFVAFRRCNL